MILQTMTPEEKYSQMRTIDNYIRNMPFNKRVRIYKILSKAKNFPYFYTKDEEIPGMGVWTIMCEAESKSNIRKGVICVSAFQKYFISHAKESINNGAGIYSYQGSDDGEFRCFDFTPHYFNRFRERYVEPKGIKRPNFLELVKMVFRVHHISMDTWNNGYYLRKDEEGKYYIAKDDSGIKKKGYGNLITYHRDGISLGVHSCNKGYVNFTTFVSNDLLKKEQEERKKRMMEELRQYEYQLRLNPYAVYEKFGFEYPLLDV